MHKSSETPSHEKNPGRLVMMREALTAALTPSHLEIIDDSAAHRGHAGSQSGAGHFSVVISSPAFKGKSTLDCHRLVYDALASLMKADIHALKIKIV